MCSGSVTFDEPSSVPPETGRFLTVHTDIQFAASWNNRSHDCYCYTKTKRVDRRTLTSSWAILYRQLFFTKRRSFFCSKLSLSRQL
ncbi:hypothetical protein PUN28_007225 [Cardiocondyla obscurior]|uniref:Uncharacterized protein n=1 Tax=Cardiocondyla obscurior TaxID=286306 RepID=A0AAW2G269_9HYME